jgi:hypothetical protein
MAADPPLQDYFDMMFDVVFDIRVSMLPALSASDLN